MYNTYLYNQRKYNWFKITVRKLICITAQFIKGVMDVVFIPGNTTVKFIKGKIDVVFRSDKECQ